MIYIRLVDIAEQASTRSWWIGTGASRFSSCWAYIPIRDGAIRSAIHNLHGELVRASQLNRTGGSCNLRRDHRVRLADWNCPNNATRVSARIGHGLRFDRYTSGCLVGWEINGVASWILPWSKLQTCSRPFLRTSPDRFLSICLITPIAWEVICGVRVQEVTFHRKIGILRVDYCPA